MGRHSSVSSQTAKNEIKSYVSHRSMNINEFVVTTLDDYIIDLNQPLSKGKFASVHRAFNKNNEDQFTVKIYQKHKIITN